MQASVSCCCRAVLTVPDLSMQETLRTSSGQGWIGNVSLAGTTTISPAASDRAWPPSKSGAAESSLERSTLVSDSTLSRSIKYCLYLVMSHVIPEAPDTNSFNHHCEAAMAERFIIIYSTSTAHATEYSKIS